MVTWFDRHPDLVRFFAGFTLSRFFGIAISSLLSIILVFIQDGDALWMAIALVCLAVFVLLDVIVHREGLANVKLIPEETKPNKPA